MEEGITMEAVKKSTREQTRTPNLRWPRYYFSIATTVAEHSKCNRDKVGSIATKDRRIIATGYNGLVSGALDDACECKETGETLPEVAHSEINLLGQLAQSTETTKGIQVWITRKPCLPCAVAILAAGVHELHCLDKGSGDGIPLLTKHALVKIYSEEEIFPT